MKKQLIICFILLSLLILTTNSVLATQYNYSTIDYPNAYSTQIAGINNYGQVVGEYSDVSGIHGFLRDEVGIYSTVDFPGASWTNLEGINDNGKIVGYYNSGSGDTAFQYDYNVDNYVTINNLTIANGINDSGIIVGDSGGSSYVINGDEYSLITYPGASLTDVVGINDSGNIVGWYNDDSGTHGFTATVVPEPISSILFLTGGAVLAGRRFLRRKRKDT